MPTSSWSRGPRCTSATSRCPTPGCGSGDSSCNRWLTWHRTSYRLPSSPPLVARSSVRVVCRRRFRIVCRRTAPVRGRNAEGGQMHTIRIIGPGRAGTSLAAALSARDWSFTGFLGRGDDLSGAGRDVDVLVLATPDDAIAEVAAAVQPVPTTTVVHLSGSLGLDALSPHLRRGALHPLVPLPNGAV